MTDKHTSGTDLPDGWPVVFFNTTWEPCNHCFEWENRPPSGRYICTRCGKSRAEPPEDECSPNTETNQPDP